MRVLPPLQNLRMDPKSPAKDFRNESPEKRPAKRFPAKRLPTESPPTRQRSTSRSTKTKHESEARKRSTKRKRSRDKTTPAWKGEVGGRGKKICREDERAERAAMPFASMKMEKVERDRLVAGTNLRKSSCLSACTHVLELLLRVLLVVVGCWTYWNGVTWTVRWSPLCICRYVTIDPMIDRYVRCKPRIIHPNSPHVRRVHTNKSPKTTTTTTIAYSSSEATRAE